MLLFYLHHSSLAFLSHIRLARPLCPGGIKQGGRKQVWASSLNSHKTDFANNIPSLEMTHFCVSPQLHQVALQWSQWLSQALEIWTFTYLGWQNIKQQLRTANAKGKKSLTSNLNNILSGSKWAGKTALTNSTLAEAQHGHQHSLTHPRHPFWRAASWCARSLGHSKDMLLTPALLNDCELRSLAPKAAEHFSYGKKTWNSWRITLIY